MRGSKIPGQDLAFVFHKPETQVEDGFKEAEWLRKTGENT